MIGTYYSKPDWHSEYYWWPKYATADRNENYDIRKHPWRWNKYKEFMHNQISELMHKYGKMDIGTGICIYTRFMINQFKSTN